MNEPRYTEAPETGNAFRRDYINSIEALLDKRSRQAADRRTERMAHIIAAPDEERATLARLLGWPLTEPREAVRSVRRHLVAEDDGYRIYRMQFEIFENYFFYGILFLRDEETPRPLVIAQHGGQGTPESCSDMLGGSNNYRNMTRRLLAGDVNVFAPQLLLWNNARFLCRPQDEGLHMDAIRRPLDQRLKQVGTSIAALEIYSISCVLDYLEAQPFVDRDRLGMCGLSYGGFYALFCAALDTRLRSTLSAAFFNDRRRYAWSDFVWDGSAELFFDSEVALLTYPRKLHIEVGADDPLFSSASSATEYARLHDFCAGSIGTDWLTYRAFEGRHEFPPDDGPIEALIRDLKE